MPADTGRASGARTRIPGLLAVMILVTGLGACGGGDDLSGDSDLQARLSDLFMQDDAMTRQEADCFAEFMMDEIDNDALRQAAQDNDLADETFELLDPAFDECFDFGGLFDDLEDGSTEPPDQ